MNSISTTSPFLEAGGSEPRKPSTTLFISSALSQSMSSLRFALSAAKAKSMRKSRPPSDWPLGFVDWKRIASQRRRQVAVGRKVAYHLVHRQSTYMYIMILILSNLSIFRVLTYISYLHGSS